MLVLPFSIDVDLTLGQHESVAATCMLSSCQYPSAAIYMMLIKQLSARPKPYIPAQPPWMISSSETIQGASATSLDTRPADTRCLQQASTPIYIHSTHRMRVKLRAPAHNRETSDCSLGTRPGTLPTVRTLPHPEAMLCRQAV